MQNIQLRSLKQNATRNLKAYGVRKVVSFSQSRASELPRAIPEMTCCGVIKAMRLWVRMVTDHFGRGHPLCALLFNFDLFNFRSRLRAARRHPKLKIQVRAEETA